MHQLLCDGQPQAGGFFATRGTRRKGLEFAEQQLLVVFGNAGPLIPHRKADVIFMNVGGDHDLRFRRRELDRIGDEIGHDLGDGPVVKRNRRHLGQGRPEPDTLLLRNQVAQFDLLNRGGVDVLHFFVEFDFAAFNFRNIEQVFQQVFHEIAGVENFLQQFLLFPVDRAHRLLFHHLAERTDQIKGVAQVVRSDSEKLVFQFVEFLELPVLADNLLLAFARNQSVADEPADGHEDFLVPGVPGRVFIRV